MSTQDTLRVDRVSLKNFRCFRQCTIDLHPQLTVLVANNGQGKTAVLDAIAISLGLFAETMYPIGAPLGFRRTDVHILLRHDQVQVPIYPTEFSVHGHVDGRNISWGRSLGENEKTRATIRDARPLRLAAVGLLKRLENTGPGSGDGVPVLPLLAFYGTGRLWKAHRLTMQKRRVGTLAQVRTAGYSDCLSPSSSFKSFLVWYQSTWAAISAPISVARRQEDRPQLLIAAVNQAVEAVLRPTGWQSLRFENDQLVVVHADKSRLPLSLLSDGVRNMVALVADLAHRCVRLNPQFGTDAARFTPGLVLIDEIDMHLHPSWQQLVVGLLRDAFPQLQFVVTTHSPQVLSAVDVSSIRVLRVRDGVGILETPLFQTRGVESADVLAVIMGVDPVPRVPEAEKLQQYRALIEDGAHESPRARALRGELDEHFGPKHPLMIDCERLLRFQAFKQRRRAHSTGDADR